STLSSSTCAIFLPRYSMSRVSRLNRHPPHVSQRTNAGGRKFISSLMVPAPSHSGHRPNWLLNENRPAEYPRRRASGTCAKIFRISSKNPTYVAGVERGVRPMGDWSTSYTAWISSNPVTHGPFPPFLRRKADCTAGSRHSRTSVLFPEPLTPVTSTKRLSGNETVKFFKLFAEASCNTSAELDSPFRPARGNETGRRRPRAGKVFFCRRHWPVTES